RKFVRYPKTSSFILGCIYFSIVISWMFGVRTSEIASGFTARLIYISAALIMIFSLATGFVIFYLLCKLTKVNIRNKNSLFIIPAAWALSEYIRAIIFSVVA